MKESEAMLEIWKIKEENSKRYSQMTYEEFERECDEILRWNEERTGRKVKTLSLKEPKHEKEIAV